MKKSVPVLEEQIAVGTRTVETGRVRLSKAIEERQEQLDVPLLRDEVELQRVRVNRPVDAPVAIRQEGDTTIVSIHEEVTVVTTQLMVTEELHIRKRTIETHHPQRVSLRRETVTAEHLPPKDRPS